jgi:CRP/FNR family transcriptional regulator
LDTLFGTNNKGGIMSDLLHQASKKEVKVITPSHISAPNLPLQNPGHQTCNSKDSYLTKQLMDIPGTVPLVKRNIRIYERGAHVFYNGDQSLALYVINSGSIKTYLTTENGEELVLGFHLPRDVVGFDGIENEAHLSSAVALETTSVLKLAFAQLSDSDRARGYPKLLSAQLAHDYHLRVLLAKKDANCRMASFLCDLARRFEMNGYSYSEFNLSMSRHDIGNYLGLAVETISRTLTVFRKDGLIDVDRRIIKINDPKKLRQIAGAKA